MFDGRLTAWASGLEKKLMTCFLPGITCLSLMAGCSGCLDRSRPHRATPAVDSEAAPDRVKEFPRRIRKAAVAGSWYPADRDRLGQSLDDYLARAADREVEGKVIALISPHAGYKFSGLAAAAGYKRLRGRRIRRVIVLAVSHRVGFKGASIADVTHYETPLGLIPLDRPAVTRLRQCDVVTIRAEAHQGEHSLEMQLPMLQRVLGKFSLVPIVMSQMDEGRYVALAKALSDIVDDQTLVVASSDFTHRGPGYSFEIPPGQAPLKERLARLDRGTIDRILALDRPGLLAYQRRTGSTICGLAPVALLLELLRKLEGVKGHVLSHYTSGDVSGSWTNTVTYIDVAFTGRWPTRPGLDNARSAGAHAFPLSAAEKQALLRLARSSLDASVRKGAYDPGAASRTRLPGALDRKAGAFVTLKCKRGKSAVCVGKGHELRGCIGTIMPAAAVSETVSRRAASAALEDRRFPRPVSPAELKHITLEVSVLTPPRTVASPEKIIIGRHGIILRRGGASATFLPQVAPEQGWDRETTLEHLSVKAGLGKDGWRSGASFSVYEAIVFSEGRPR